MNKMIRSFLIAALVISPYCSQSQTIDVRGKKVAKQDNPWSGHTLTSRAVKAAGTSWGYELLVDDKTYIRQLTRPGTPGNTGFRNEADAQKVAAFAIEKMKNGSSPALISEADLKTLNVL